MPPFVPRKRARNPSPKGTPSSRDTPASKRVKTTVFEDLDVNTTTRTVAENKAFLDGLAGEHDTSQSEADSDEFEDVGLPSKNGDGEEDDGAANTDDEMEWEDAITPHPAPQKALSRLGAPREFKDLEITLSTPGAEISNAAAVLGKKGPSRKERRMRIQVHCMHVQCLLYHNFLRNSWINDKEVQKILVDGLSDMMKSEVARYRRAMGNQSTLESTPGSTKDKGLASGPGRDKGKGKGKSKAQANSSPKSSRDRIRDWGADAARLEPNAPDLSQGDPLLRLLKYLSSYWKKRFRITAPGLRKRGHYLTAVMAEEIHSFRNDPHAPARHGERIKDIQEFRDLARKCEGSRDVGAQLFTALLRALNIEARLIASLQPAGFGWNKAEDATPKKLEKGRFGASQIIDVGSTGSESEQISRNKSSSSKAVQSSTPTKRSSSRAKTNANLVIDMEESSELSSAPEELSDASLIDITPSKILQASRAQKAVDSDLQVPIYWTEALSPITNTYIPVSPLVLSIIATTPEQMSAFEPRGKQSDKSKQVISYVVAYTSDGTAKDVTVRYLKRRQLPGKTKGVRLPVEKLPVYGGNGKIKRYEQYDWFKETMRSYTRSAEMRTLADEFEDDGDLVPLKATTKPDGAGKREESLQAYKTSAEYVLERHLRREEAILPSAKIVRHFTVGKGENAKEEPVYLRKDVVTCKTVESWHKEGREVKKGEQPLKMVPIRAVTLVRKREIEDQLRENGEKPLQGLYSRDQTDWIIPEPISDGKIPRNAFGNIDVYVPSMVPKGAAHVPLKGTAKICKKLGIDFAEACTGFEFGKQRAVPVLTGVVVAEENEDLLKEAWVEEEAHKRKKEEGKREKAALAMWRKFLMGLRIVERVQEEYGNDEEDVKDAVNPFTNKNRKHVGSKANNHADESSLGGGFLLESDLLEEPSLGNKGIHENDPTSTASESDDGGGGFIVEHDISTKKPVAESLGILRSLPISLQAAHANNGPEDSHIGSAEHKFGVLGATELEGTVDSLSRGRKGLDSSPRRVERPSQETDKAKSRQLVNSKVSTTTTPEKSTSASLSVSDNDEVSIPVHSSTTRKKVAPRQLPKRQAAKKSQTATRSHYFEQGSDDD